MIGIFKDLFCSKSLGTKGGMRVQTPVWRVFEVLGVDVSWMGKPDEFIKSS